MTSAGEDREGQQNPSPRVRVFALLCGLIALALALRLYRIGTESIDLEEYVGFVHLDAPDLLTYLRLVQETYRFVPPLAFALEYLWASIAGPGMVSVRLLFVLIGLLNVVMAFVLARALFAGRTESGASRQSAICAGIIAALCMTLSPVQVFYAQEARQYALLVLLGLVSNYGMLRASRSGQRRWWVLNVATNCAMVATHPFGALLPFAQGIFIVLYRPGRLMRLGVWLAVHVLLATALLAWAQGRPSSSRAVFGFTPKPEFRLDNLWRDVLGDDAIGMCAPFPASDRAFASLPGPLRNGMRGAAPLFGRLVVGAMALVIIWALWRMARGRRGDDVAPGAVSREYALLLLWLIMPPLMLTLISTWRPCHIPRYTAYCAPAAYILLGGLVASIPRRGLRILAAGAVAVLFAYQAALALPGPIRAEWREVGPYLASHGHEHEPLLFYESFYFPVFQMNADEVQNPIALGPDTTAALSDTALAYLRNAPAEGGGPVIWLLHVIYARGVEEELRKRGLAFDMHQFGGARPLLLYRVTAEPATDLSLEDSPPVSAQTKALVEALATGQPWEGLDALREAVAERPDAPSACIRLAFALAEKGQKAPAEHLLQRAQHEDLQLLGQVANIVSAHGGAPGSAPPDTSGVDAVLEALETSLGDGWRLSEYLLQLRSQQRYEDALAVARKAVERYPDFASGYGHLGSILLEKDDDAGAAIGPLQHAIALDPHVEAAVYSTLAQALKREGHTAEALDCLRQGVEHHPEAAWLKAELAVVVREQGGVDEAVALLDEAAHTNPPDANIWLVFGETLLHKGDYAKAAETLKEAARLNDAHPWIWLRLWTACTGLGEDDQARDALNKAISLNPEMDGALGGFIKAYYEDRDLVAAAREVESVQMMGVTIPPAFARKLQQAKGE